MDRHVHISEQVHMWLVRPVNMMWCAIEVVFRIEWTVRLPVIQFQFKCAKHGNQGKECRKKPAKKVAKKILVYYVTHSFFLCVAFFFFFKNDSRLSHALWDG